MPCDREEGFVDLERDGHRWIYLVPMRVRFAETDANRHVSQASYVLYFEDARTRFLEAMARRLGDESGNTFSWWGQGSSTVIVNQFVEYVRPAFYGQWLLVLVRPERVGRSSLDLAYLIVPCDRDQEVLTRGTTRVVRIDAASGHSLPWPPAFAPAVAALMGREP
ncbi:Thioesterase [Candidatus Hydrogenisulfobacillus filiaventi]|uniref:Thioesterase n=1 Tax=Candidatus Hydrogenisulfobacillus filiaventi TaxID=2707344 RepID=A0A6F8ZJP5_9FIRM|nr:thioesterase family protein [Bacillota bacterium]CAB1130101.1 Thioesterase [Candidatus Hydrogenisulfobacillus filiaventi]